jgi:hypothetical protein
MSQLPRPSAPSYVDPARSESDAIDPELLSLPDPPRGERNFTVAVLALAAIASLAMCGGLARDASYAFASTESRELGDLNHAAAGTFAENVLVRGEGLVGAAGGIRYERPFEADSYRLMPLAGRADLWVELRVPSGEESGRYVPPSAFEGRLVRFDRAGLRHRGLAAIASGTAGEKVAGAAWLLVDGETPERSRWAVTLVALFFGFAVWNLIGILRLVRRVR